MGCFPLYFSLHFTTCHYKGRKAIAFVDNNQQRAINNLNFSFLDIRLMQPRYYFFVLGILCYIVSYPKIERMSYEQ